MTEHSIEELERQYQSAKSKHEEAANNVNAAKKRLDAARLAATGLEGHKVSYTDRRKSEVFFIVREIGRYEVEAAWRVLKDAYFPGARNNSKNMAPVRAALSAAAKVRAIREGDGDWPLKARVWFRESTNEKVLEIQGAIDGTFGIWRHTQPGDTPNDEVPSLAASPIPATTGGVK